MGAGVANETLKEDADGSAMLEEAWDKNETLDATGDANTTAADANAMPEEAEDANTIDGCGEGVAKTTEDTTPEELTAVGTAEGPKTYVTVSTAAPGKVQTPLGKMVITDVWAVGTTNDDEATGLRKQV